MNQLFWVVSSFASTLEKKTAQARLVTTVELGKNKERGISKHPEKIRVCYEMERMILNNIHIHASEKGRRMIVSVE